MNTEAAPRPAGLSGCLQRLWAPFGYILQLVTTLVSVVGALIMVVLRTFYVLLPATAHSARDDSRYDAHKEDRLSDLVDLIDREDRLDPYQVRILRDGWLDQIRWTGARANRERNADELIRWWQIIFGVLIPVLVNLNLPDRAFVIGQISIGQDAVISALGVTVAILTAVYQFRRPEQRWRHYRTLSERYQNEFWAYVALAGRYEGQTHRTAFQQFNTRMIAIREEDVVKFFGEVVPPSAQAREADRTLREEGD